MRDSTGWQGIVFLGGMAVFGGSVAATDPGPLAHIELRQNAQVDEPQVTFGEVANISSRDLSVLQRLMTLSLGQVPRSGEAVGLEQGALLQWIGARLGLDPQRIAWRGPATSQVRMASNVIAGEQLAARAEEALRSALAEAGRQGEIHVLRVPPDVNVPGGSVEMKVRPLVGWRLAAPTGVLNASSTNEASTLFRRQSVWVDLWIDGRFLRAVPVSCEVVSFVSSAPHAAGPGPAEKPPLAASQTRADERPAVRDLAGSMRRSAAVAPSPHAAALEVSTPAFPPSIPDKSTASLMRDGRGEKPVVTRGDSATLHSMQGTIALESRVEILQDGAVGQNVRVRLPQAASSILARVVGPGTVELRQ